MLQATIENMADKPTSSRLGKAATTLNVSKDTILEFLKGKGIVIDDNPMTKIEGEVYQLLLNEFSSDLEAKEKTEAVASKIREARETITLEDKKKGRTGAREEEEPEIDLSKFKRKKAEPVTPPAPAPAPAEEPVAEASAQSEPETEEKKTAAKKAAAKKKVAEDAEPVVEPTPVR
jgi:translation initiation factor IF-2